MSKGREETSNLINIIMYTTVRTQTRIHNCNRDQNQYLTHISMMVPRSCGHILVPILQRQLGKILPTEHGSDGCSPQCHHCDITYILLCKHNSLEVSTIQAQQTMNTGTNKYCLTVTPPPRSPLVPNCRIQTQLVYQDFQR